MGLLDAGKNLMLNHLGSESVKVRLYDDADAEILNLSSASQDKTISWNSATGGSMSMASSIDFENIFIEEMYYLINNLICI